MFTLPSEAQSGASAGDSTIFDRRNSAACSAIIEVTGIAVKPDGTHYNLAGSSGRYLE